MMVWIAAAVSVFYSLWSVALALLFSSWLRVQHAQISASVALVLPATGALPGLEDLLAALTAQSLRPRRLIVAVELRADPAYSRVCAVAEHFPQLNIELVVAGLSPLRSQKCTNLLAALAHLGPEDAYVVLLDADIRPQAWWLATLVAPLAAGRADVVDGYRWPVPTTLSMGAVLIAIIDRAVAVLPRLSQTRILWGGSLALSRHTLEILDLPKTIGRALSDDLSIAERVAKAGLRVLTRRAVRVPTPIEGSLRDFCRFGRRQYQLVRLHRPGLWWFAAFVVTTDLLSRLVLSAALIGGTAGSFAAFAWLTVAGLGSISAEIRMAIGNRLGAPDKAGFRLAQHSLAWTILPLPAFHAGLIWSGFVWTPIDWGHVRYLVDASGKVVSVLRHPHDCCPVRPAVANSVTPTER